MLGSIEREALRRLGALKLTLGLVCLVAAARGATPAALLHLAPALLGAVLAAGGLALLLAGVFAPRPQPWRTLGAIVDLAAIALLFGSPTPALPVPLRVTVPPSWDPSWTAVLIAMVTVLNGATAPLATSLVVAVIAAASGWYVGYLLPAAAAGVCAVALAAVLAPLRRQPAVADLPDQLAHAAGRGILGVGDNTAAEANPLTEADLRAAAAALAVDDVAVLVNDASRRQRTPSGDLHVLRRDRYAVHRVPLDAARADDADALGFFAPAGLVFPAESYVKLLNGQSGIVGRVVIPSWSQPAAGRPGRDAARAALLALLTATWSLRLDNYRLARDAEARLLDIVESLITSVEAKDYYTSGHSKRVCKYSLLLAESFGLGGRALDEVAVGAALHDVGKLGIPEQVLSKPSKLDDAEWEMMRSHPKVGARIIDSFNQSEAVLHMIFHHHERFDGRGYPAALKGEEIPFHARIVGVADAFDAMTSGRVYQRNRTVRDALEEVRRNAGTQFDPSVADALLTIPVRRLEEIAPRIPQGAAGAQAVRTAPNAATPAALPA